ncbi:MAG TPA: Hsp70 family protein, partial [Pseudonocardiaceae bacterium]|nr:Hsp70 family protein [Pseudonocardiaceae bacterium]
MGYWLGIDVGGTATAAALCRGDGPAEVVALGSGSATVPSVLYLGDQGQVVVGKAAQRWALTDPDRVVRAFTGRIGDEVPMVIGGHAYTAAQLTAMLVSWVVDQVAAQQGGPAAAIVVTHPASWGDYKRTVLAAALADSGLSGVQLRCEPEAAAATAGFGQTLAIYDLGGSTFDATVIRTGRAGETTVMGSPQRLPQLGGADFDDGVFRHVLAAVPALTQLDSEDPATLATTADLRHACTRATQALSADTEVTIPVSAAGINTQVRLHRAEFDDIICPYLGETLHALRRALHSAQLQPQGLDAVMLIGGSARIPLVAQLVSTELDQPITIDADPATTIARGAATLAARTAESPATLTGRSPEPDGAVPPAQPGESRHQLAPPSLTAIPLEVTPAVVQRRRVTSQRVKRAALAGSLALLAAAASVPFLMSRSNPGPQAVAAPAAATAATAVNGTNGPASNGNSTAATPVAAPMQPAAAAANQGAFPAHVAARQATASSTVQPVKNSGAGGTSPAPGTGGGGGTTSPPGTGGGGGTTSPPGTGGGGGTTSPPGTGG